MNKYLFDTSIWIWCWNEAYPRVNFEKVYTFFTEQAKGKICYIDQIEKELEKKDDDLYTYFKDSKEYFSKIEAEDPTTIINRYYLHKSTIPIADQYIISTAKKKGLIIVTAEKGSSQQLDVLKKGTMLANPKIPNISKIEEIKYFKMKEFWVDIDAKI